MLCKITPYEGTEPYIFLSYCHKDADTVYPLIERMSYDGYRIWYDDGIHPGSDWPEVIAVHLHNCAVCLCMISEASSSSHNCKNELSVAIEFKKPLTAVLLEDFLMPLGMRLQLASTQYIKKYELPGTQALFRRLYASQEIQRCKGEAQPVDWELLLRRERESSIASKKAAEDNTEQEKKAALAALWAAENIKQEGDQSSADAEAFHPRKTAPAPEAMLQANRQETFVHKASLTNGSEENGATTDNPASASKGTQGYELQLHFYGDDSSEKLIQTPSDIGQKDKSLQQNVLSEEDEETPTIQASVQQSMLLLRQATGESFPLYSSLIRLGRSAKKCDITFANNATISNHHADIIQYNNQCYLRDANSANGTFVDGVRLAPGGKSILKNPAFFQLSGESFQFVSGLLADWLLHLHKVVLLQNAETLEKHFVVNPIFHMGRSYIWPNGTFDSKFVSHDHASIIWHDDIPLLQDEGSTNGTYVNSKKLSPGEVFPIHDGDQLRIGNTIIDVKFKPC